MLELKAKKRDIVGKKVKNLRNEGFLPAVVYGEKVQSQPIAVPFADFERVYRETGESTLLKLDVDGTPHTVLIYRIENDPLKGSPIHADFYAVRMDKKIRTRVPVKIVGESPAVKNEGGILVTVMHELEIEALPMDLPHELTIDISSLKALEDRVHVRDVPLPKGVEMFVNPDDSVVVVEAPRTEEEMAALEEAPVAEEPSEVKTEQEVKAEEKTQEEGAVRDEAGKDTKE